MEEHAFSGGIVKKMNDVIMYIRFDKDHEVLVEDVKDITRVRKKLFGSSNYCSLIDVRKDFLSFSDEAKKHVSQNPKINALRISEALLVRNFGQKLGVDIYIRLFKPGSPSRSFVSEEKAINWLMNNHKEFMRQQELQTNNS